MIEYPKRVYPRGHGKPGVTVQSLEEERLVMGQSAPAKPAATPVPATPLSSTAAVPKTQTKQEEKAAKKAAKVSGKK